MKTNKKKQKICELHEILLEYRYGYDCYDYYECFLCHRYEYFSHCHVQNRSEAKPSLNRAKDEKEKRETKPMCIYYLVRYRS